MSLSGHVISDHADVLHRVLAEDDLRSRYQPIVDLTTMATIGYEALVRGPAGSPLELPGPLFEVARADGRLHELDRAARRAAARGATAAGLGPGMALFVNIEPETLTSEGGSLDWLSILDHHGPRIVLEVTERAITSRPAEMVSVLRDARDRGASIAVDDLGAEPASLALLPIIAPDVIKLDLSLIQDRPSIEMARIHSAVAYESERTGASVLAEGIETAAHLDQARGLGATLGQGYLLGRPGAIDTLSTGEPWLPAPNPGPDEAGVTPYDIVAPHRSTRVATKQTLIAMSHHLEEQAARLESPGVCLSAFQEARNLTPDTRRRYHRLARSCSLVAAFAADLDDLSIPGVRTGRLAAVDPLRSEWSVVVVGSHHAAALVARDLGDTGPEPSRRFSFAMTHDRSLVIAAARSLLCRIAPAT